MAPAGPEAVPAGHVKQVPPMFGGTYEKVPAGQIQLVSGVVMRPTPRHCEKAGSTAVESCVDAQAKVHEATREKTPVLDV